MPVTTFLVSTLLLSSILPTLATGSAAAYNPSLVVPRHEGEHRDASGMGSDMHAVTLDHDQHADESDLLDTAPTLTSSSVVSIASSSASPSASHTHQHDGSHDHGSHSAAKTVLDDESVHRWHHFPPTYLDADFKLDNDSAIFGEQFDDAWNVDELTSHKELMAAHLLAYYGAYFGLLPITLALRAVDHPAHYLANAAFISVAIFGWSLGKAHKAAHENRYEGAVHEPLTNLLLILSVALSALDLFHLLKRCTHSDGSWSATVRELFHGHTPSASRYEMVGLVEHEPGDDDQIVFAIDDDTEPHDHHEDLHRSTSRTTKPRRPSLLIRQWSRPSRTSTGSDGTLHDTPGGSSSSNSFTHKYEHHRFGAYDAEDKCGNEQVVPLWSKRKSSGALRALELSLTTLRRAQVVIAYVVFLTEFTEYTGMCRAGLINSCAAHYIKGSIFFWYGVLTFGRYLGAYADLGWAWNKSPGGAGVSAEMVECCVIFFYGITNTWMERFGSKSTDPYTVKQVQHISIAVMFWFAGLSGILLESKWVRKLMGSFISGGRRDVVEPASYTFSYNPLPALVIGVTGLAMAAHHQEYVFQVSIHSLWGALLAGGSLFRFLTYFFLFSRPPVESTLPSRPPTEVLTAFGYAAGGIVFMLSNEEIAWAAMRAGWDDMMAFLNFTVALTSLVFCWAICVMAIKGWAGLRMTMRPLPTTAQA